jgi:hypothetical protein
MTDRDRLAADLQTGILGERNAMGLSANDALVVATRWADRLIALGWTRLDEERLARALTSEAALLRKAVADPDIMPIAAAAIAKAYREDADAVAAERARIRAAVEAAASEAYAATDSVSRAAVLAIIDE